MPPFLLGDINSTIYHGMHHRRSDQNILPYQVERWMQDERSDFPIAVGDQAAEQL
jgi:hypothetical protein